MLLGHTENVMAVLSFANLMLAGQTNAETAVVLLTVVGRRCYHIHCCRRCTASARFTSPFGRCNV